MKEGTARVNLFIIAALVLKLQFVNSENKIFYTIVRTTVQRKIKWSKYRVWVGIRKSSKQQKYNVCTT